MGVCFAILSTVMTSRIKQLDPVTVTKIAAGEVVDRPASILKELIENAIDAQATSIVVTIENGGKDRIVVSDNGTGISKDDLVRAPLRHATSKINSVTDIYTTCTFGFRGEALASICHCATLHIVSKQADKPAYQLTTFEDTISAVTPSSHPQGTSITVGPLFENIPVRQRFLKSATTEAAYCYDACLHMALSHPNIAIRFCSNQTEKLNTGGTQDLYTLLLSVYGNSLKGHCVPVNESLGPISIKGYISAPTLTFSNRTKQLITVNQRLVSNTLITKALNDSFRDLIPHRRFPLAVLAITLATDAVDVNVHPQKKDVKFTNPGFLFDCIPKAIGMALKKSTAHTDPLTAILSPTSSPAPSATPPSSPPPVAASSPSTTSLSTPPSFSSKPSCAPSAPTTPTLTGLTMPLSRLAQTKAEKCYAPFDYIQVLNTYIFLKTPTGAYLIDQHAVHERILYEKLKSAANQETSRHLLLISDIVNLTPATMDLYTDYAAIFESLRFTIEPFGSNQLAIRECPLLFKDACLSDLILELLECLKAYPHSQQTLSPLQKETLQRQACRAAIKAGQTLHPAEINALLHDFIQAPQNMTCPHGRPLAIHFDEQKLASLFLRK